MEIVLNCTFLHMMLIVLFIAVFNIELFLLS